MLAVMLALAVVAQDKPPDKPAPPPEAAKQEKIAWVADYDAAVKKAKDEKKFLLLHFTSEYCQWCRKMESEVFPKPEVVKAAAPYINAKLDTGKFGDLWIEKYNGGSTPSTVILTDAGEIVTTIQGFLEAVDYVDLLVQVPQAHGKLAEAKAAAEKSPKDAVVQNALADLYGQLRRRTEALDQYKKVADLLEATTLDEAGRKMLGTAYYRVADAYAGENRWGEVKDVAAKYEKLDPDNTLGFLDDFVPMRVSIAAQVERDLEGAMGIIDAGLKKFPDSNVADQLLFFKGFLYQMQRDEDGAKKAWEECAKKYPDSRWGKQAKQMAEHGH